MQKNEELKGASFLVRIWKETEKTEWRGQIEHIQTGRKTSFTGWETMAEVCRRLLGDDDSTS